MRKINVFEGLINGERFTDVASYNKRMNELLNAGEKDIQASSSTTIKYVEDEANSSGVVTTCTTDQCPGTCGAVSTTASTELQEDEDLSFYPYMEDDDPFYLDLLVTSDYETNAAALAEVKKIFGKCFKYITTELNNNNVTDYDRKSYLESICSIIEDIKNDKQNTNDALNRLHAKRQDLTEEFENYKRKFESNLANISRDEKMLSDANDVIYWFENFYGDIRSEIEKSIKSHKKCKCTDECTCDHDNIITSCTETQPQVVSDFDSLLKRIFDLSGLVK